MPEPDFSVRAADYDRLRPVDERWWALFERLVAEAELRGQRVLDVGCGTGRLAAALAERGLARVWGVDPEPAMLERARQRVPAGVGLKQGSAERLPFREAWFDRVVFWLSVHLVERPTAFAEAARVLVPRGSVALVTFEPEHFAGYWLNRFFPSIERVDRARFPRPEQLERELVGAGFAPPRFVRIQDRETVPRAVALERVRAGHISTFDLLDPDEVRAGIERAERELPELVEAERRWLLVVAGRAAE